MRARAFKHDRIWGLVLIAFAPAQLLYLYFDVILLAPPDPDAPISEFRALASDHAALIRWHALIPPINFLVLLLPASVALARRLRQAAPGSFWPEMVVPGSLLLSMTAVIGLQLFAVLGLVPVHELSDSAIRSAIMINAFLIWVVGSFAAALLAGSVSLALLHADPRPRMLVAFGLTAAGCGLAGQVWLVDGDFHGPLFGLNLLGRGLFLAWVVWAGIWLVRSPVSDERERASPGLTSLGRAVS
jgi:hypothetical protein